MWRIPEIPGISVMKRANHGSPGLRAEITRDPAPVRRPVRACLISFAVFLSAVPLLWDAHPGHCRQGNGTVLTNAPSESESQAILSGTAEETALASMPEGHRSRSAIRRLNPELVKKAKIQMQLEANSEPIRPGGTVKPAPVVSTPASGVQPSPDKASASGEQLTYMELPSRIRDSIPLSVTMLVYSDRSDNRSITVNSCRILEGEEVAPGLKVEKITSDGAVFSYQGYRFSKRVVGD